MWPPLLGGARKAGGAVGKHVRDGFIAGVASEVTVGPGGRAVDERQALDERLVPGEVLKAHIS